MMSEPSVAMMDAGHQAYWHNQLAVPSGDRIRAAYLAMRELDPAFTHSPQSGEVSEPGLSGEKVVVPHDTKLARCMGGKFCIHRPGTCTATATYAPTTDARSSETVEQIISAWAFAHDIDGAARNDLFRRIRAALSPTIMEEGV